jgi:hypothetical protein
MAGGSKALSNQRAELRDSTPFNFATKAETFAASPNNVVQCTMISLN